MHRGDLISMSVSLMIPSPFSDTSSVFSFLDILGKKIDYGTVTSVYHKPTFPGRYIMVYAILHKRSCEHSKLRAHRDHSKMMSDGLLSTA